MATITITGKNKAKCNLIDGRTRTLYNICYELHEAHYLTSATVVDGSTEREIWFDNCGFEFVDTIPAAVFEKAKAQHDAHEAWMAKHNRK
jgi:N-acetylglutamate synthase-like GNAT family acetyltransferase